jgi:hypothetical protein
MTTNFFFNNFTNSQEQLLIENLIVESIKIYGQEVYYCPRITPDKDDVYGEDNISKFNSNYLVEMYIKNVEGFEGEADILSRFNVEIRDQMTLTLARRVFENEIGNSTGDSRPLEGSLIYFPLNKKIFQIKFVEHESIFYQMGSLQVYDLVCELFEYSNERLNTGIAEIDNIQRDYSLGLETYGLETSNGLQLLNSGGFSLLRTGYDFSTQANDALEDNVEIQTEADGFLDFSETDPFSEGTY